MRIFFIGRNIKIWNALTGDIKKIFSDLTVGEISVAALDKLKRRLILGDSLGYCALFNVSNGAKIKNLPKHNLEVTCIIHMFYPE